MKINVMGLGGLLIFYYRVFLDVGFWGCRVIFGGFFEEGFGFFGFVLVVVVEGLVFSGYKSCFLGICRVAV